MRGWFYPAEGPSGPGPAVVMAHGFSAVKEMRLDRFAEALAEAGLAFFLYSTTAVSEQATGCLDRTSTPYDQIEDYR